MALPYAEVIGDPIAHSKSPMIHKFWLETLGIEAEYRAVQIGVGELAAYLQARRADPDWRGCNVTRPHKVAIVELLDALFPSPKVTGAVNTVVSSNGHLVGNNTDVRGLAEPFRDTFLERGSAALIGAGGAARAAFIALTGLGFEIVHVANRSRSNAEAMLGVFNQPSTLAYDLSEPIPAVDLLVNASAMGSGGEGVDLDLKQLPSTAIVYDLVYDPLDTALLRTARARGLRTIDGLHMLVGQAAASFTHFFSGEPPRQYDSELRKLLTS